MMGAIKTALAPYAGALRALLIVALALALFRAGMVAQRNADAAERVRVLNEQFRAYEHKAGELDALAAQYEVMKNERQQKIEIIRQTTERIVERPVYRGECLDDDGLRVANAAIAGRADSGESAATVPAAGAAGR